MRAIPLALCLGLAIAGQASRAQEPIKTRYGDLTSDGWNLVFRDKVVEPEVAYLDSASYSPVVRFRMADSDVVLFRQAQGNSCPGAYAFVTVTRQGAKATPLFGSCYDGATEPVQSGDTISFSMTRLGGRGKIHYSFRNGVVFENGVALGRAARAEEGDVPLPPVP